MHPIQDAYVHAKAAYDAACFTHTAELERRGFWDLLDRTRTHDDGVDERLVEIEMAANAISHHDATLEALGAAENALLAWGKVAVLAPALTLAHATIKDIAAVEMMFATVDRHPTIKTKLIATILRYDATT